MTNQANLEDGEKHGTLKIDILLTLVTINAKNMFMLTGQETLINDLEKTTKHDLYAYIMS